MNAKGKERACSWCGGPLAQLPWRLRDRMYPRPEVFSLSRCRRCRSLALDSAPAVGGEAYPADYYSYAGRPPLAQAPPDLRQLRRTAGNLAPGSALDVGCGSGHTLDLLAAEGWRTFGVEVSPTAARRAVRQGHSVFIGEFGKSLAPGAGFDLVRLRHVLEHLPDGPERLRELAGLLRPGGWLVVEVPNCRGLLARLSRRFWWQLDPPRHLELPAPCALARAAHRSGLEVIELVTHSRPSGVAKTLSLLVSRLFGRPWYLTSSRPSYYSWLLRLGRPLAAAFDLLRRGDNLILLARKAGSSGDSAGRLTS